MGDRKNKVIAAVFSVLWIIVLAVIGYRVGGGDTVQKPGGVAVKMQSIELCETDMVEQLNTVTLEELDKIYGIGPKKAAAIVEMREKMGGFHTVDDLMCVDGVGDSIIASLKEYFSKKNDTESEKIAI